MTTSKRVRVSVSVKDLHISKLDSVVTKLQDRGFTLDEGGKLESIGVVTGSVPQAKLDQLKKVDGVSLVEQEKADYTTQSQ